MYDCWHEGFYLIDHQIYYFELIEEYNENGNIIGVYTAIKDIFDYLIQQV
jgi:hypothetical protein